MRTIGVLAIQGDFAKHSEVVRKLGHVSREVRTPAQLDDINALIIPGGESTTLLKLFALSGMADRIKEFAKDHPVMGTCAGLIVLANHADWLPSDPLDLIDIDVERNFYGRQKESFSAPVKINLSGKEIQFDGVFIRAPRIKRFGTDVSVIGYHNDDAVMVRQGHILACSFHPELTDDPAIHQYFINMIK